jgi:hypothetical protein
MRMVNMIISGVRCNDYEKRALVSMLGGKKKTNDKQESFETILDREIKKFDLQKEKGC